MQERITNLILPFAVSKKDKGQVFTENMEIAAIFYLAESERNKGKGRFLKKPAEKLVFITKVCYPIYLVSWKRRGLIFDGLGINAPTLSFDVLPDIEVFNADISSAKTYEGYSVALSQNVNYFQNFGKKDEKTIKGLITDPEFIQDFVSHLSEAEKVEKPTTNMVILSSIIDEAHISSLVEELSKQRSRLKEDTKNLRKSMKLLSNATKKQVKNLQEEIKEIQKRVEQKIEEVKPSVTKRIRQNQERCDREITVTSRRYKRRLRQLHKSCVEFERMRERLTADIDRCDAGIKSCKLRKDEGGEIHWTHKLEKIRKELPTLEKNIKDIKIKIEGAETAQKLETSQIRGKLEKRIERATKILRDLEVSREARDRMILENVKSLEDTTSTIIIQINSVINSKKAAIIEIESLGIPRKRNAVAYLPLYFVCYEAELTRRFVVYPPSILSGLGIFTKLRGVFGATKMKRLLQPRSKAIETFLYQLIEITIGNPVFEKEISDAAIRTNILRTTESRMDIKKGLRELTDEGWISESELQIFNQLL